MPKADLTITILAGAPDYYQLEVQNPDLSWSPTSAPTLLSDGTYTFNFTVNPANEGKSYRVTNVVETFTSNIIVVHVPDCTGGGSIELLLSQECLGNTPYLRTIINVVNGTGDYYLQQWNGFTWVIILTHTGQITNGTYNFGLTGIGDLFSHKYRVTDGVLVSNEITFQLASCEPSEVLHIISGDFKCVDQAGQLTIVFSITNGSGSYVFQRFEGIWINYQTFSAPQNSPGHTINLPYTSDQLYPTRIYDLGTDVYSNELLVGVAQCETLEIVNLSSVCNLDIDTPKTWLLQFSVTNGSGVYALQFFDGGSWVDLFAFNAAGNGNILIEQDTVNINLTLINTWQFRVRDVNFDINSLPYSLEVIPCSAIELVSIIGEDATINFLAAYEVTNGIGDYHIQLSLDGGNNYFSVQDNLLGGNPFSGSLIGILSGGTTLGFKYRIEAKDISGNLIYSNVLSF